jgi:hypothetical protein
MTSYSVYQDFVKITIAQRLDVWGFKITEGSELIANGKDYPDANTAEFQARLIVARLKP